MSRPFIRRAAAAVSAALLSAGTLLTASGPAAAEPAASPAPVAQSAAAPDLASSPVLQNLAACIGEKKTGDLVVLIDTSGSLSGAGSSGTPTDPTDVRVAGAQALLGGLARSLDDVGATVDVTVAGFDDNVTPVVESTPLTKAGLPALDGQLAGFADRDRGAETDYWTALNWLNRTLQDKAAARAGGPESTCQFAIWFTDGAFTIWPRDGSSEADLDPLTSPTKDIPGFEDRPLTDRATADAALAAAKDEMCRPGGTADQLRAADITMIGVGLGGGADADRFAFMQDVVTNPNGSCGTEPVRGVFVPADSVGDLYLALADIGRFGQSGPEHEGPVCQGQPCPEGTYTFALDNTLSAVHMDAVVDDGSDELIRTGIQVTITPPTGPPIVIDGNGADTGTGTSDLATADYEWLTGGPLAVDLVRAAGQDWTGDWKVTFVDTTGQHPDAVTNIALTLTSDFAIAPVPVAPDQWRVGGSVAVRFEPQTLDGTPIQLTALPAGFTATAEVDLPGPDRTVLPIPVSLTDPSTIDLPAGGSAGLAVVIVRVDGQVAGQALATVSRQATVTVQPPFDAPQVDPAGQVVDFGKTEGVKPAAGTLRVVGPEQGDGCVSVGAGSVQGPRGVAAQFAITGADGCFPVPQGQPVDVPLTLIPSVEGNGLLTGDIVVALAPADSPQQISEQRVGFRLDMVRTPQVTVLWVVLVASVLLGLLVPILVMWLVRRMSARFPPAEQTTLQSVVVPVRIGAGRITAADGGHLAAPVDGWSAVPPPGPGRRTLIASGVPLRARAGWRLSEPGYAELDGGGDDVGAGPGFPASDGAGRPRLPLAVQGAWLVLAPRQLAVSPIDTVQARLLLVVETAADAGKRDELVGLAVADAPAAFEDARRKARESAGATEPPAPGPGAPAGPGSDRPATPPPWGAAPAAGSGSAAPGRGSTPAGAPPGWGAPPPSGGGRPPNPSSGWPPNPNPSGGGWPPNPNPGPSRPPASGGWGPPPASGPAGPGPSPGSGSWPTDR